jgi:hypothetical protein
MTPAPREQRRGRAIAMTKAELDDFLTGQRTVGEVPRTGLPDERLTGPELLFARKYRGEDVMDHDGRHAWLRLVPDAITSWDFSKINRQRLSA